MDKVVFQYPVCLLSLTGTIGKLLLRLSVTSGTLCTINSLSSSGRPPKHYNQPVRCCKRKNEAIKTNEGHRSRFRRCDIYVEVVLLTVLALPWYCDHRGKNPTTVSTNRHTSDESPKLWNRHALRFSTSSSLSKSWQHSRRTLSRECCQHSLRDDEVENRNAAIDPSFRFSRSASWKQNLFS